MNIFLFIDKYTPNPLSCAKLMYDLATEIKSLGHQPFVFTIDNNIKSKKTITNENGITVIRTLGYNTKTPIKILRAYAEITMSQKIINNNIDFINKTKCDYLIVYSPSIFWTKLIKKIKEINNCKSYLILRDLFPQWLIDTGIIKRNGLIDKFFSFNEKLLYDNCDVIGVQSPSNLNHFNKDYLKKRYNLEILYNWIKITKDNNLGSNNNFKIKNKILDKIIYVYSGNIGIAQDLMNIVKLAKNLKNFQKIHFLIIGNGTEKEKIKSAIISEKLSNITLLPSVEEQELIKILSICNVGIISLSKELKTENIPGKLLSYCQAGIPIIASINRSKDLRNIIVNSNIGFVSNNGDDEEFSKNAINLFNNTRLSNEYGKNAKMLIKKSFNVNKAAKQILDHY